MVRLSAQGPNPQVEGRPWQLNLPVEGSTLLARGRLNSLLATYLPCLYCSRIAALVTLHNLPVV